MKMVPVESTAIESIGYSQDSSSLTVIFRDGHVYEFHLVPRHVFEEFVHAPSKGSFFNEKLKSGPYGQRRSRKA